MLVGPQDPRILAAGNEVAEGRLAEMVHDGVLDASQLIAGLPGALGVVVVLEQPDLIALIQRPDVQIGLAAHRKAEHRRRSHLEPAPRVLGGSASSEVEELAPGAVIGLNLGLVADPVGDGADQPTAGFAEMRKQPESQPRCDHRVVIEEDEILAAGQAEALVAGRREAHVLTVEQDPNPRVLLGELCR